jgi:RNA polymerase sigma factor (sigma-70 family)
VGRNRDDLELVERCVAGEPGAWRQFVDRFAPTVRALARRYLRLHGQMPDSADLDDVVQDVFLALTRREFRLLKNYDPTYTFKTYLGVITRTEVHRILRKKRPLLGGPAELERAAPADAPPIYTLQHHRQDPAHPRGVGGPDALPGQTATPRQASGHFGNPRVMSCGRRGGAIPISAGAERSRPSC